MRRTKKKMNGERLLVLARNLIFPPRCVFCERIMELNTVRRVCGRCSKTIVFCSSGLCCVKCGKPIVSFGKEQLCYFCIAKKPKYFDRIASVFEYSGHVREAILRYKEMGRASYAREFGECMAGRFFEELDGLEIDFICAVPSHADKKVKFGFDQVELLCRELAALTDIPYLPGVLVKKRKTRKQHSLSFEERQKNIADSMETKAPEDVVGKSILVVDDVCTTRATLSECSRALKNSGARRVYGLTLATTKGC